MISGMTMPDIQKTVKQMAAIERLMKDVLKHVDVMQFNEYRGSDSTKGMYRGGGGIVYLLKETATLSTAVDALIKAIKPSN